MDAASRIKGQLTTEDEVSAAPAPFPLSTGFHWWLGIQCCAGENIKKSGKKSRIFANKNVEDTRFGVYCSVLSSSRPTTNFMLIVDCLSSK